MEAVTVAVAGNITRDTLYYVDRLPLVDDVATVRRSVDCLGGRGAATSTILSGSYPVRLVTGVPRADQSAVTEFLRAAGDDGRGVEWHDTPEAMSNVLVTVGKADQDCTSLFKPGFESTTLSDGQYEVIALSDILYLTTHGLSFNLASLAAARTDCIVIANITTYMFARPEYRDTVLERANVLVGNKDEWQALFAALGCESPRALFTRLPRLQQVFRTLGARGAQVFDSSGNMLERPPTKDVNARTPVGVGDAFAAGVLAAHIRGANSAEALGLGIELAQLSLAADMTCVAPAMARAFFETA